MRIGIGLALTAIVIMLWLPFGVNIGFWLDGWAVFQGVDAAHFYGAVFAPPASRPALYVAWEMAYALDPDSYTGVNLLLIALLTGKAWLTAAIIHRLTGRHALAFAAGALALLIPADSGVFYLGALNLHSALFCWLLGTWALLRLADARRATRRIMWGLIMGIALLIATATYEVAFVFTLVGLGALLAVTRALDRRFWTIALAYCAVPGVMSARYALLLLTSDAAGYQTGLIDPALTPGAMIDALVRAYFQHFIGGWAELTPAAYLPYAIGIGLIAAAGAAWLNWREAAAPPPARGVGWRGLMIAGLVMIALGVLVFLPTTERSSTLRIFYFSSLGMAILIAALAYSLTGRRGSRQMRAALFGLAVGAIACVGGVRLLDQHALYVARTAAQQRVLADLIAFAPAFEQPSVIFIEDDTDALQTVFPGLLTLRAAVSLIYQAQEVVPAICNQGICYYDPESVRVDTPNQMLGQVGYDRLIVLRYDGDGFALVESLDGLTAAPGAAAYDPRPLIRFDAPRPARADTMLPQAGLLSGS